jgi:hypothetical protein
MGPEFLSSFKSEWVVKQVSDVLQDGDPEVCKSKVTGPKSVVSCATAVDVLDHPVDIMSAHYSGWLCLKQAVGWLMRFKEFLRSKRKTVNLKPLSACT